MKTVALLVGLLVLSACGQEKSVREKTSKQLPVANESAEHTAIYTDSVQPVEVASSKKTSPYHYTTIYTNNIGWGYDILEHSTIRIHQPHIPAVQGNQGFKSAEDASKVAEKIIEKLERGIMPPTLSIAEMQELGVL